MTQVSTVADPGPNRISVRVDLETTTVAALVLIALQLVVRLVVTLPSYYWQDDFIHLELARRVGLTGDFLLRDHNDHLELLTNFVYWALAQQDSRSFLLAGLLICVLQLAASLLFWRVLRHVLGPGPLLLVPLTAYLFTPLALVTTTWLAAALQALSFQLSLFAVLLGMLRLHRGDRVWWGVMSVAAYAAGMLAWEKTVLVLPGVVGLLVLVAWRHEPLATAARRLLRHRWVWSAHVVVLAAYVVLYLSVVDGSERTEVDAAPYLRSALTMLAQVLTPGLIGGPWHTDGAENTLYPRSVPLLVATCGLILLGVVVLSFRISGRAAWRPWALAGLYVAGDVGLMLWGRANYLELVDRDPRYLADAVPVIALCAAAALSVRREESETGAPATSGDDPLTTARMVSTSAVLLSSCLLTTFLLAPVLQHSYPRNFVEGMVSEFRRHPGASVVNTESPAGVAATEQRDLLAAVGFDAPFDQPGTRMRMFDSLAQLRDIELRERTVVLTGPEEDCGWPVGRQPVLLGMLPASSMRTYVLRVGYVTGAPARLHIEVDGRDQTVDVRPGLGHAFYVVSGLSGPVRAWTRQRTGVCVSDLSAGKPWPAD